MVPRTASKTKTAADATYAHPKKGFLPPIQDTVDITKDLVPLYGRTGKSSSDDISGKSVDKKTIAY